MLLNPVPGAQLYVEAPEALREVDVPAQIGLVPPAVITGTVVTETAEVAVLLHPPKVPVTVYVVVELGLATGL